MMTIIEAIAAALIKWLSGWLEGRKASADAIKASNNLAQAEAHSETIRDHADEAVEQARQRNDAELATARSDGLQQQSADVRAAIAQANCELRRA